MAQSLLFLTLSPQFQQPHLSDFQPVQLHCDGAGRRFPHLAFMDEQPETDEGYVTLVNVEETNGELRKLKTYRNVGVEASASRWNADLYQAGGRVVFDHVDFGYTPDKTVLHDISLYAEPGQKIAFVGATGAGKTTITNLINRFYDIDDGKIRYDGININKIRKADLRRSLRHCPAGSEPLYRNGDGKPALRKSGCHR